MVSTKSTPSTYAEISANGALALLAVACSLLDRQLASLARAFESEGGFTERLYRVRSENRKGVGRVVLEPGKLPSRTTRL